MSIFFEVIQEELARNKERLDVFVAELAKYHKGSLSKCTVDGVVYIYRKWREGSTIKSEYIGLPGDINVQNAEKERETYLKLKNTIKEIKLEEKRIRKVIEAYESVRK